MSKITATFTRGSRKGKTVEIHQYCNDWAMLEDNSKIVSLTSLAFEVGSESHKHVVDNPRVGMMWAMHNRNHFIKTGRFVKLHA